MRHYNILIKKMAIATLIAVSSSWVFASIEKINAPIVQPGAPGQPSQTLDATTALAIADSSYTSADVHFMQGMILHHHQALLMSRLASDRTNNENVLDLAGRIDVSQDDEIMLMQDWLKERSEMVPDPADHHSGHMSHDMVGMATAEQMTNLANSKSIDFDELFLSLMITHHDGAIKMVKELRDQPGSAYDPLLNEFVSDVANDQAVEIERMNELLVGLSSDPRAGLAPGLFDAEEAILNLELVVSQRKPPGFYDPNNPAARGAAALEEESEKESDEEDKPKPTQESANALRYPMLSFSNTDMAFSDDLLVTGS